MKKTANELIFISQINRDGSGTSPVSDRYIETMINNKDEFNVLCLSMSKKTYIANGFNSFVVKLK